MSKPFHLFAAVAAVGVCSVAQASQEIATDVHVGYGYATKVLANAGKDCKAVRRTIEQADGSAFVECLSENEQDDIRYRITPLRTSVPLVEFVSRKTTAKEDASTPQEREARANRYATTIIRGYRYECLQVVSVTNQEDNSLVAVCTPEYGSKPISYRLVETPDAYMKTRVIPID